MNDLRKGYHEELEAVRNQITRMAAMVTEVIPRATDAFLNNDLQAAQRIIDDDDLLDMVSIDVDDMIQRLLALQQPMARDLRELVVALRLNSEIERSGDLACNIAKATRRLYGTAYPASIRGVITKMSVEAERMFRLAGEAYAERDAGLGAALDDIDDRLDELNVENVEIIFGMTSDELAVEAAVQLALIGRFYERIGDHAVNVGERVQYIVTGLTPEHTGAARARARTTQTPDASGS